MRDILHNFGNASLATKDTDVYCADELDWGTIDARFLRSTQHLTGVHEDGAVVFVAAADFVSTDGLIPFLTDGASTTPTEKCLIGPQTDLSTGAAPKKGIAWVLPLPRKHRRFMRAGCTPKSSGTFTARTASAYIEYGPND